MSLTIGSISTLHSSRQLSRVQKAIARAMERLSSGRAINSASENSALLASSLRLDSQRIGTLRAIRNINEAIAMTDVASSALQAQSDIMMRLKELALRASNGTLSNTERESLDSEFQGLLQEFEQIAFQTKYNGTALLDSSYGSKNIQVGTRSGDTISMSFDPTRLQDMIPSTNPTTIIAGDGTFSSGTTLTPPIPYASHTVSGDFNGDGKLDLVTSHHDLSYAKVTIRLGNGDGTFQAATSLTVGNNPRAVEVGDFNNDGKLDLATANPGDTFLTINLGNGDGTFQSLVTYVPTGQPYGLTLADVNNDGNLDVLTGDQSSSSVSVFLGNGNGTFQSRITVTMGSGVHSVHTGDLNGDGKLDIVTADQYVSTVSIRLGNGDGTFAARTTLATGSTPLSSRLRDINNDNKLDLIVADSGGNTISLYLGNGNGTFAARTTLAATAPHFADTADLNEDGNLDIVVADYGAGTVSIYLGNGNGTFQSRYTRAAGTNPSHVHMADFDGDSAIDIISSNFGSGTNTLYFGNETTTTTTTETDLSITTQAKAEALLDVLDTALERINSAQANVGALHSRLEYAASANLLLADNLTDALSLSRDADYALEIAELVKNQMLADVITAALSQSLANQKSILSLLDQLN